MAFNWHARPRPCRRYVLHLTSNFRKSLLSPRQENLYRPLVPPPIKHLCYAALADLFKYLPESKANPQAVDIRQKLQIASWMSLWPLKLEKYRCVYINENL